MVLLLLKAQVNSGWICACPSSWCERYRSGTGARQSDLLQPLDKKPAPRSDYIVHAPLLARSTLRSAHMLARRNHSRREKAKIFFHPVSIFFPLLRDKTVRPIRFELRSRDQSSCGCTKGRKWWRCFQNQCEQTLKKSLIIIWEQNYSRMFLI